MVKYPHVSIIILNWNGWQDTIECLESVLKLEYKRYNVILIDNNSEDDSIRNIREWLDGTLKYNLKTNFPDLVNPPVKKPVKYEFIEDIDRLDELPVTMDCGLLFIKNSSNLGFAKASNQGILSAQKLYKSKYYFLLNNDTVIDSKSLDELIFPMEEDKHIGVSQATIYNYYNPNIIANAGGRILFWGQTKYYKTIRDDEIKPVSFINGCALCIRHDIVKKYGLLSENFFFGEEDFEFSYRLKKANVKKVCHGASRVFHKIGNSSDLLLQHIEKKVFLFSLNRFVDLKQFYPKIIWYPWRLLASIYFIGLLSLRYKVPQSRSILLIKRVSFYASRINNVRKETLDSIFKEINL